MRNLRVLLAIVGVSALAACGGGGTDEETPLEEGAPTSTAAALDLTGSWVLESGSTSGGEIALVEGSPVTLDVAADGAASGTSACNQYNTVVTVDGTDVSFDTVSSTAMACPDDVMAVETAYIQALGDVNTGSIEGETLTLSGNGAELVFSAGAAPTE
jgi:heat shock protein HslJ